MMGDGGVIEMDHQPLHDAEGRQVFFNIPNAPKIPVCKNCGCLYITPDMLPPGIKQ